MGDYYTQKQAKGETDSRRGSKEMIKAP